MLHIVTQSSNAVLGFLCKLQLICIHVHHLLKHVFLDFFQIKLCKYMVQRVNYKIHDQNPSGNKNYCFSLL